MSAIEQPAVEQQVARARVWLATLPENDRPDLVDVEFAVRLGVRDPQTLYRLLWKNPVSLGRHLVDLLAALDDSAHDDAPGEGRRGSHANPKPQAGPPPAVPEETRMSAVDPSQADPTADPRRAAITSYLAEQKARDPKFVLDEAWAELALADAEAALKKLPPRIAREHRQPLAGLLQAAPSPDHRARVGHGKASSGRPTREPDMLFEHRAHHDLMVSANENGETVLRWPGPNAGQVAEFRVFAGVDGTVPLLFEGRELDEVTETTAKDTHSFTTSRRHYSVWGYLGADEEAARSSKPVLWARGVALQPVQDVELLVAGDDVSGTWTSADGIDRVEVYRLELPHDVPPTTIPHHHPRVGDEKSQHLAGFQDQGLRTGEYEYRIYACANIDGSPRRSAPVIVRQRVAVPVPVIDDLQVAVDPDRTELCLSWTKPADAACQVEIHWRGQEAPAGIVGRDLDIDALERSGFTRSTRISRPPESVEGRQHISVAWPVGMDRVYITPITRVGSVNRIGQSVVRTRAGHVTDAAIVERVNEQYLRFTWPSGADFVTVRLAPPGDEDSDPATWPELRQISREKHQRYGGVHLDPPLPADGCTLALIGIAYHDNGVTHGGAQKLRYPGLTRIDYRFSERMAIQGRFKKREVSAGWQLELRPHRDIADLPFVLVRRADRLPLHGHDGERVLEFRLTAAAQKIGMGPAGLMPKDPMTGYLRLFVDVPDSEQLKYAVLDPDFDQLWWASS